LEKASSSGEMGCPRLPDFFLLRFWKILLGRLWVGKLGMEGDLRSAFFDLGGSLFELTAKVGIGSCLGFFA